MKIQHKNTEAEILSKIIWKTNIVRHPFLHSSIAGEYSGSKSFIGRIQNRDKTFIIKRNRYLFLFWLPRLFIVGRIEKKQIQFNFRPGILTSIFYLFIVYGIVQSIWVNVNLNGKLDLQVLLILILNILIIIALTIYEYDKSKKSFLRIIEFEKTISNTR